MEVSYYIWWRYDFCHLAEACQPSIELVTDGNIDADHKMPFIVWTIEHICASAKTIHNGVQKVVGKPQADTLIFATKHADIYCYMHWSQTTGTTLNANLSHYNKFAKQYLGMMEHEGTRTGTKYTSLIPVGLSIQNARSTYLALLAYNTDATLNLTTDTQIGLQRDGGHLSFNIGRYIAGLTFAEMIVPEDWRADNYVLPEIRITESVGKLPKEYSEIAQKAVHAAVESWKNGSLAVTNIDGYTQDPTVAASKLLQSILFRLNNSETSLVAQLESEYWLHYLQISQ